MDVNCREAKAGATPRTESTPTAGNEMSLTLGTRRGPNYVRNLLLFTLICGLVAAYIVLPIGFAIQDVRPPAHFPVCCVSPADLDLRYEEVTFAAGDGLTLAGWYIPSRNGAAVIGAHARNGNRTGMIYHAAFLAQHGYGVLIYDLRGHGDSGGESWAFGWEGQLDVLGALDYLRGRPEVDPDRIGALGLSAGAEAVLHATAVSDGIKAVVADGGDLRLVEEMFLVAGPGTWAYAPGWLVYSWALPVVSGVPAPPSLVDLVPMISPRPLLLIAAGSEEGYEIRLNRIYYAAAGEPKQLWELPDSSHIRGLFTHPTEYRERVLALFDAALLPNRPG